RVEVAMIFRVPLRRPVQAAADEPIGVDRRPMWTGKRPFDLGLGLLCLVVLSPLLAVVAVMVRLTTPGPALFAQTRIGRGGRPFVLYKFRTMYDGSPNEIHREYVRKLLTDAEPPAGGRQGLYKLEDDARITPVGRLLRRLSVDELPQLFNVLRGE